MSNYIKNCIWNGGAKNYSQIKVRLTIFNIYLEKIDRNNYSFTMNQPFSSEFGNVYNDKYMIYSPVMT